MPDFKRLVSYMYTYEEGKKRNNVGYARVEARNGQCKFTIHVSALSYNDKQVTVYAFKRNKNEIEGIQLGKFNFRNEVGDFRLVTDPNRILNTGYGIEDIGGIVLYNTSTKYLATVWDENPLSMDMVASLEFKVTNMFKADANVVSKVENEIIKEVQKEAEVINEAKNEDSFDKVTATAKKETIVLKHEVINQDNIENRIENVVDNQDIEKVVENINQEEIEKVANNVDNIIDSITENTNQFVNSIVPEGNTATSNDESVHDLSRRDNSCGCNNTTNPVKDSMNRNPSNNYYGNFSTSGSEESPIATKFYKEYPRMYPFEDSEIIWCVRIEPKDIGIFPVDVWPLANNSFLLHGFYGHRHLIFAKVNNRNSNSYIIGVPGIYHNRERFMAKMFGFENFKCAKKRDRREGEFGYWYVPVNLKQ